VSLMVRVLGVGWAGGRGVGVRREARGGGGTG